MPSVATFSWSLHLSVSTATSCSLLDTKHWHVKFRCSFAPAQVPLYVYTTDGASQARTRVPRTALRHKQRPNWFENKSRSRDFIINFNTFSTAGPLSALRFSKPLQPFFKLSHPLYNFQPFKVQGVVPFQARSQRWESPLVHQP
jgi:hypothetical protein